MIFVGSGRQRYPFVSSWSWYYRCHASADAWQARVGTASMTPALKLSSPHGEVGMFPARHLV
jgi:hypothetical protein